MGAFADEEFIALAAQTRTRYAKEFNKLIDEMRSEIPLIPKLTDEERLPSNNRHLWEEKKYRLDKDALRYWNGWEVKGRKDKKSYLPICLLWNSHGKEFAEKTYTQYARYVEKKLAPSHTEFSFFITYLSQNAKKWPESTFYDPVKLNELFIQNLIESFKSAVENGVVISWKTIGYAQFIYQMEEAFIQPGVWARPFNGSLPHPKALTTPSSESKIKKMPDGTLVKEKLITPIPIELSDSEAIEIIFKTIKSDNQIVLKWAKSKLIELEKSQKNRSTLAKTGKAIHGGKTYKKNLEEVGINDLCTTFETLGLAHIRENGRQIYGRSDVLKLADILAIPTPQHFFALQLLLISNHQCLTESFFDKFELYNKHGKLSGVIETDTGYQLVGYKDRKGSRLSEQTIQLNPEEQHWVQLIISATDPLRNELKKKNDDAWRLLFLRCTRILGIPKAALPFKINATTFKRGGLFDEFLAISPRTREETKNLLLRVSITAYRASCAVELYLNTNDVVAMAKALGHRAYNSSLLSRYLPEPILAFFQTRWIRAFQRGIVCEAMKESRHLLRAAQFTSMEELHKFLENHALRALPAHLENPYKLTNGAKKNSPTKVEEKVLVPVDVGTLTALISIEQAVSRAKDKAKICAKALYWSKFTRLVTKDIESSFNSDLQRYLGIARNHANPEKMENLIYETTSRA
ncbi:hypothetical protein MFKK_20420 [Halopseudomonas aestusnigri]|nr:hypothetical protein MFKK_20420 [Halopseudomonas aestusnigri]